MRRLGLALVLILAVSGCGSTEVSDPGATTDATAGFPEPGAGALEAGKAQALQAILDQAAVPYGRGEPGVTAAVVSDRWTWSGAAGRDSAGTKLVPATSMGVASITKTFIAAEVLLLAERQKVGLDEPISTYVKHKLTANGATVRQHLAMQSGLANYQPDDYTRMDKVIKAAPGAHWTAPRVLSYFTGQVAGPGAGFAYSNPSFVLLGLMIEKVTGEPLAAVLRKDLAATAGLPNVAFQDGEKPRPPLAEDRNPACGKSVDGFLPCRSIASLSAANAGLAADAPSVARWGYQLYGDRVLPAGSAAKLTAGDGQYGLGTVRFSQTFGTDEAYGHRGEMPDHTSLLVVIPAKRVSIALLCAGGRKQLDPVMVELAAAVERALG